MRTEQAKWSEEEGWLPEKPGLLSGSANLVLLFGSTKNISQQLKFDEIRNLYPEAIIFGCSTAGEIFNTEVNEDSLVLTAIEFNSIKLAGNLINLHKMENSFLAGRKLADLFEKKDLVHIFVLSDGLEVNGSDLVKGMASSLPAEVTITGGLSGDSDRFNETYVFCNSSPLKGAVAAVGFYGNNLKIGYASMGGWDPFGPERLITRSNGNILYELDGKSALELYKKYLGRHADHLPAAGLLFPLSIRSADSKTGLVRTILSIDEESRSMTFAGDIPEGYYARLMKANIDRLIDGAVEAAKICNDFHETSDSRLAILISCVGRKMVMKQRVEEEIEGVSELLGSKTMLTGFYSYGEIAPSGKGDCSSLHNQTMTIMTISEK